MLFSELWQKDKVGAFKMYLPVSTLKEEGKIPESYHEVFKDVCECGSEKIINRDLTTSMCCNPRCKVKLAHSLDYMFSKFQCRDIGLQTCKRIIYGIYHKLEIKSHIYVLNLPDDRLPTDINGSTFFNYKKAVHRIKESRMTFSEMVSKLGIPGLGSTGAKIFEGIKGMDHFADLAKEHGGIDMFLASRGVYDPMKVFYLTEFLQDIAYAEFKLFKPTLPVGNISVPICLTGRITFNGISISKEAFVSLCNDLGHVTKKVRLFDIKETKAIQSTDYLIADYRSNSRQYITALERESMEKRKIIYSSDEFFNYLKEIVDKFKSENNL